MLYMLRRIWGGGSDPVISYHIMSGGTMWLVEQILSCHEHYVQVHPLWDASTMLRMGSPCGLSWVPSALVHASHVSSTPPHHLIQGLGYIGGDAYARARA